MSVHFYHANSRWPVFSFVFNEKLSAKRIRRLRQFHKLSLHMRGWLRSTDNPLNSQPSK
jgi:hypothetical protein